MLYSDCFVRTFHTMRTALDEWWHVIIVHSVRLCRRRGDRLLMRGWLCFAVIDGRRYRLEGLASHALLALLLAALLHDPSNVHGLDDHPPHSHKPPVRFRMIAIILFPPPPYTL